MIIWLTGCTSGLGRALLSEFVKAGHVVVGGARRLDVLEELALKYPTSFFCQLDITDDGSAQRFCQQAYVVTGAPHLLLNNAATIYEACNLWDVSAEVFDKLMITNVSGVTNMIRHTVPCMIEGAQTEEEGLSRKQGVIVNFSSTWGRTTESGFAPYCASKWAIEGLTQSLAREFRPMHQTLAAVSLNPGVINTPMLQRALGREGAMRRVSPEAWATVAAPYLTAITPAHNGQALSVPA